MTAVSVVLETDSVHASDDISIIDCLPRHHGCPARAPVSIGRCPSRSESTVV